MRPTLKSPAVVLATAMLSVLLAGWTSTTSQMKVCTDKDAEQALNLPVRYKDWDAAYRIFKRFGQCDDGAIAEGYSEAIAQLLAHDWEHLNVLIRLTSSDKAFKEFVLRHIDETLSEDELQAIVSNSRLRCPIGGKAFCKLIETRAVTSLDGVRKDLQ